MGLSRWTESDFNTVNLLRIPHIWLRMVVPNENIAGMEFWRKLWRDLIPHAAYDILKWLFFLVVAAVIAAVVAGIQHFRHAPGQDLFGNVILALLIFCSLLMTVIFFSGSRKREASLQPATIPTEAALVEEKQPEASLLSH